MAYLLKNASGRFQLNAGGFILITGLDGIRYAVRPQSVGIIHDADECRDETLIQLHGGHIVRVPCSLDEVLAWFS